MRIYSRLIDIGACMHHRSGWLSRILGPACVHAITERTRRYMHGYSTARLAFLEMRKELRILVWYDLQKGAAVRTASLVVNSTPHHGHMQQQAREARRTQTVLVPK